MYECIGEGEEKISDEILSSTSQNPTPSSSKSFAFIESPFTVFPAQDSVGIEQFRVKKDWRNAVAFLKRKGHLV